MGFFLTLVYLVIIYIRPQEFIPEIQGWPILTWLAGISIAVVFLEGGFSGGKFKSSPVSWLIILFWGALCMSHIANFWFGGALKAFDKFSKVAIVYFLVIFTVDTWPRLKVLLWTLVLLATFLSCQAIWQYYTGVGLVGGEALLRGGEVLQARGIGIFADPNDLALNIVPLLSFLLPAFHKGLMSRTWVTGVVFLVPMITGVAFTRSRGGVLGLAAVAWYYLTKRVGKVVGVAGLLVVLSLLLAIPRMETISADEDTARARLDHWSHGLNLLRKNPVFGVGMDRFTDDHTHTAHNSFILVLGEAGLVGAVLWVAMIFGFLRDMFLIKLEDRGPPYLEALVDSIIGAMLGWLVCAFFLSQTYKFLSFIIMALGVAVLNCLGREGEPVRHEWGIKQWALAGAITVGGVVFMHLLVRVLWGYARS